MVPACSAPPWLGDASGKAAVEYFFREPRRALEGPVYPTLRAKKEVLEPILRAWQADPARVRQLCGWRWIREALKILTADTQVIQSQRVGITW